MQETIKNKISWELIGVLITITLAIGGYLYSYFHDLATAKRQAQLERVNLQLRNLYGPLFALTQVSEKVWIEFREKNRPPYTESYWNSTPKPTKEQGQEWRIWISSVFMPMNTKMESLILENADLLEGSEMPDVLIDLSAHIAGYKAILAKWKNNNKVENTFEANTSFFKYPGRSLKEYAYRNYNFLRGRQRELIGELE